MDPSQMSQQDLIFYAVLLNTAIGFILGLFPLVFGIKRGRARFGALGMVASVVGGAILGVILSVPVALIFTWLVTRQTAHEPRDDGNGVESNTGV